MKVETKKEESPRNTRLPELTWVRQLFYMHDLLTSSQFMASERVVRGRASERRSRGERRKEELATISYKFSFLLRPDEAKYHWLKSDAPPITVFIRISAHLELAPILKAEKFNKRPASNKCPPPPHLPPPQTKTQISAHPLSGPSHPKKQK